MDSSWLGEQVQGGLTVAVLGAVDQHDMPVLRRIQHHTTSALAVALDVEGWTSPDAGNGGAVPVLTQTGWRAVALGPRDRLDTVWQELGRTGSRAGRYARPVVRERGSPCVQRPRTGLGPALGLALAAAATTWFAMLSWRSFTVAPAGFLGPLLVVGLSGRRSAALLRRLPWGWSSWCSGAGGRRSDLSCSSPVRPSRQRAGRRSRLQRRGRQRQPTPRRCPTPRTSVNPLLLCGGLAACSSST